MFKCIYKSLFLFFQMVGDDDVQDGIAESVVEISCGTLNDDLNLSDSSDDDENTRVNRLSNERPAPAPVTPDRTASPATVGHETASSKASTDGPRLACGRCTSHRAFGKHEPGCVNSGVYYSFASCPRCRSVHLTHGQLVTHWGRCLKSGDENLTRKQRRHQYDVDDLIVLGSAPVHTKQCRKCNNYRARDDRILHIHEILCMAAHCRPPSPALPAVDTLIIDDVLTLPMELAIELSRAFKKCSKAMSSQKYRTLYQMVDTKITATFPPNFKRTDASPTRNVKSRVMLPGKRCHSPTPPSRKRQFTGQQMVKDVRIEYRPLEDRGFTRKHPRRGTHHTVYSVDPKRDARLPMGVLSPDDKRLATAQRVKITTLKPKTAVVVPTPTGRRPPWDAQELQKLKVQIAQDNDVCEKRDLFKIKLPCASWVDAYGRPMSPPAKEKIPFVKADPNMRGQLVSTVAYCQATEICVKGHLPTGWGEIFAPGEKVAVKCYKSTPGDVIETPLEVLDLPYWINLHLTTGTKPAAGRLYTSLDLSKYDGKTLDFCADHINSFLRVRTLK